jgi:hypothetical protein
MPTDEELSALRAWYAGLSSRDAVKRFLPHTSAKSSRGALGRIEEH